VLQVSVNVGSIRIRMLGLRDLCVRLTARCAEGPVYNIYHPNTAVYISLPVTDFAVVMLFL
jgi:hypothetical protein